METAHHLFNNVFFIKVNETLFWPFHDWAFDFVASVAHERPRFNLIRILVDVLNFWTYSSLRCRLCFCFCLQTLISRFAALQWFISGHFGRWLLVEHFQFPLHFTKLHESIFAVNTNDSPIQRKLLQKRERRKSKCEIQETLLFCFIV